MFRKIWNSKNIYWFISTLIIICEFSLVHTWLKQTKILPITKARYVQHQNKSNFDENGNTFFELQNKGDFGHGRSKALVG